MTQFPTCEVHGLAMTACADVSRPRAGADGSYPWNATWTSERGARANYPGGGSRIRGLFPSHRIRLLGALLNEDTRLNRIR